MKRILFSIILLTLLNTKVMSAKANCSGGECEITSSYHYEYIKTDCLQTMSFEEVKTDYLYFIILNTEQRCSVFESK